jgi:hypothetical protein
VIERLGAAVTAQLERLGPAGAIGPLVEAWPFVVGDAIARHAWPARVARDGTLHVTTSSSAWAFELTQLAPELLERLRASAGAAAPSGLRFAPGRVPEPAAPNAAEQPSPPPRPSREEIALAVELAAPIEDDELRETVARAAAASLARAASGRSV